MATQMTNHLNFEVYTSDDISRKLFSFSNTPLIPTPWKEQQKSTLSIWESFYYNGQLLHQRIHSPGGEKGTWVVARTAATTPPPPLAAAARGGGEEEDSSPSMIIGVAQIVDTTTKATGYDEDSDIIDDIDGLDVDGGTTSTTTTKQQPTKKKKTKRTFQLRIVAYCTNCGSSSSSSSNSNSNSEGEAETTILLEQVHNVASQVTEKAAQWILQQQEEQHQEHSHRSKMIISIGALDESIATNVKSTLAKYQFKVARSSTPCGLYVYDNNNSSLIGNDGDLDDEESK